MQNMQKMAHQRNLQNESLSKKNESLSKKNESLSKKLEDMTNDM